MILLLDLLAGLFTNTSIIIPEKKNKAMTTSTILHIVGRRGANNLFAATAASASHPTIRSLTATASAASASAISNGINETEIRGVAAAAIMAAAGLITWKNESEKKADCAAITAVVGKGGFGARCATCRCFILALLPFIHTFCSLCNIKLTPSTIFSQ